MYSPYQKGAVRVGDGRVLLLTSGTRTRPQTTKEGEIPSGDAKNRKDDLHDGGGGGVGRGGRKEVRGKEGRGRRRCPSFALPLLWTSAVVLKRKWEI